MRKRRSGWGLSVASCRLAQLEGEVKTLAQKIAQGPPIAIRAVKKLLFGSHEKD